MNVWISDKKTSLRELLDYTRKSLTIPGKINDLDKKINDAIRLIDILFQVRIEPIIANAGKAKELFASHDMEGFHRFVMEEAVLKETFLERANIRGKKYAEKYTELEQLREELDTLYDEYKALVDKKTELAYEKMKREYRDVQAMFHYENGFLCVNGTEEIKSPLNRRFCDDFSFDDLILVHVTNYFPKNGIILTKRDGHAPASDEVDKKIESQRNTIHFTLNSTVSEHIYGKKWDEMPIVILDQFNKHIGQFSNVNSGDTWTYGSVKLSDEAIIIIPISEFQKIYEENSEYINKNRDRIVLYNGPSENKKSIVNAIIALSGRPPQDIGTWGWTEDKNSQQLTDYVNTYKAQPQSELKASLNSVHMHDPDNIIEVSRGTRNILLSSHNGRLVNGNEDVIITPEELCSLYDDFALYFIDGLEHNTYGFVKAFGIQVLDNEIHLLGQREHTKYYYSTKDELKFQVEKIELIMKKYRLMQIKGLISKKDKPKF